MTAFISGIIFGLLLAGSVCVIIATRTRRPRREPVEWMPEFHEPQAPPVTTRIIKSKRTFDL